MKRLLLGMGILGGAALLGGCPIYPSSGDWSPPPQTNCEQSSCGYGYTCDPYGECVPVDSNDASVAGQCGYCPPGTTCGLADGVVQCLMYAAGPDASTADAGPAPPTD